VKNYIFPKLRFIIKIILIGTLIFSIIPTLLIFSLYELHITQPVVQPTHSDVALVLGAGILKSGDPGPILAERITTAIALYQKQEVNKILVTGNSADPSVYDETSAMRQALIKANIPKENIIVDPLGIDTYASIYRAKYSYHVSSMIITTQSFHLPRALFIAKALGISAYGIEVDKDTPQPRTYLHEMLAMPKAILNVLMGRVS
jgi:vancomycin permeability regulator SanA